MVDENVPTLVSIFLHERNPTYATNNSTLYDKYYEQFAKFFMTITNGNNPTDVQVTQFPNSKVKMQCEVQNTTSLLTTCRCLEYVLKESPNLQVNGCYTSVNFYVVLLSFFYELISKHQSLLLISFKTRQLYLVLTVIRWWKSNTWSLP